MQIAAPRALACKPADTLAATCSSRGLPDSLAASERRLAGHSVLAGCEVKRRPQPAPLVMHAGGPEELARRARLTCLAS